MRLKRILLDEPIPKIIFFKNEFEQMGLYLDLVELSLHKNLRLLEERLEIQVKDLTEGEKDGFYEYHYDDIAQIRDDFPQKLYTSFVITWYSFVEQELINLCDVMKIKLSISIKDNDRLGEGIRRAYRFLHEGIGYEIDSKMWNELTLIGRIRNKLVHEGPNFTLFTGKPNDPDIKVVQVEIEGEEFFVGIDQAFYQYLTQKNILHFVGFYQIRPTIDYCRYLISFGTQLLEKIHTDLKIIPE